jgi:glyoxylase-like metal-dependent hydrolase (beta-lactamase superfamily II)
MATVVNEVALGVHRLGSDLVNFYFVEDQGRVTVVDAGVPGFWNQLEPALRHIELGLENIDALLLTHAHSDHTGIAGKLHERGVPIYLHPADHELLRTGKESWKREASALPALRHPRMWKFFLHMIRNGALNSPKVDDPRAINHGDELDVPGRPRVIHTPGHTPGHCAFHFERHSALFTGDLLVTWHPILGRRGPQIMPSAFNMSSAQALESLDRIENVSAGAVLPGHGEPFSGSPAEAVAEARATGRS